MKKLIDYIKEKLGYETIDLYANRNIDVWGEKRVVVK